MLVNDRYMHINTHKHTDLMTFCTLNRLLLRQAHLIACTIRVVFYLHELICKPR